MHCMNVDIGGVIAVNIIVISYISDVVTNYHGYLNPQKVR